ncbi:hypothetical protein EOD39_9394 [Acipenser ruthenus]|uniref:Uncharacterized protein n=1 Tax=Acipenser ruthenus TaxID=7906 RepID=A0A662YX92_ACIRT|nr:hypothetical protein EOD39_9394 [Acipenser ruthenus]
MENEEMEMSMPDLDASASSPGDSLDAVGVSSGPCPQESDSSGSNVGGKTPPSYGEFLAKKQQSNSALSEIQTMHGEMLQKQEEQDRQEAATLQSIALSIELAVGCFERCANAAERQAAAIEAHAGDCYNLQRPQATEYIYRPAHHGYNHPAPILQLGLIPARPTYPSPAPSQVEPKLPGVYGFTTIHQESYVTMLEADD